MMEPSNFHVGKKPEKKTITYYKECLKNHAASIGGNATDGCGEFMPSGEDGTPESLKCSACNCHRNFHRKLETESSDSNHHHHYNNILPLVPSNKSGSTSPSDCEDGVLVRKVEDNVPINKKRKRFRTKFTKEQKERMLGFAEEAGWRIQKLEECVVQRFCQEVGIKRRVLKVWMHNNKNTFAKKNVHLPN